MRSPIVYLLAVPLALVAVAPLFVLLQLADGYMAILDVRNLQLLANTLALALLAGIGSVVIGVPLAFFTTFVRLPLASLWLALFAAPLAIPSYLGAFAFYAAFGPGGEIESLLGLATPNVGGLWGCALVISLYTYPFVMLATRASLLGMDANTIHAARTLGVPLRQCLVRVVLPRAVPSIAAGALLTALYAVSDFGTPAIMNYDTFTRLIYVEYNAYGLSQAALFSLQLLLLVAFFLLLEGRLRAVPEKPGEVLTLRVSRSELFLTAASTTPVLFLSLALPLVIFAIWLQREGAAAFDLSIAWNSALASGLAACVAVLAAIPIALAARRGAFGRLLERVTFFGFGVPGIVMGTVLVYVGLRFPVLYQTLALLVLAYVMRFFSLAVSATRSSFEQLDGSYQHAARLLGAGRFETFVRVTLPISIKGILAGAALVFLEAMRELPATLLLAPTGFETLATYLWRVYEAGYFGRAALPSLLLIVVSAAGLVLVLLGEGGRRRGSHGGGDSSIEATGAAAFHDSVR